MYVLTILGKIKSVSTIINYTIFNLPTSLWGDVFFKCFHNEIIGNFSELTVDIFFNLAENFLIYSAMLYTCISLFKIWLEFIYVLYMYMFQRSCWNANISTTKTSTLIWPQKSVWILGFVQITFMLFLSSYLFTRLNFERNLNDLSG